MASSSSDVNSKGFLLNSLVRPPDIDLRSEPIGSSTVEVRIDQAATTTMVPDLDRMDLFPPLNSCANKSGLSKSTHAESDLDRADPNPLVMAAAADVPRSSGGIKPGLSFTSGGIGNSRNRFVSGKGGAPQAQKASAIAGARLTKDAAAGPSGSKVYNPPVRALPTRKPSERNVDWNRIKQSLAEGNNKDWRQAANGGLGQAEETVDLIFKPPVIVNDKKKAFVGIDSINRAADKWKNSIIFYVYGARPYHVHLKAYIERTWKPKKQFNLLARDNGFFIIRFVDAIDCENVLKGGPYLFDNRIIILKKWETGMRFRRDLLSSLPIWVKLQNLELEFWDKEAISAIASVLGKPLKMDRITADESRIAYARVLIEMTAEDEFPNYVDVIMHNGEEIRVAIAYDYKPILCKNCKIFGHSTAQCKIQQSTKWIPKSVGVQSDTCQQVAEKILSDGHMADHSIIVDADGVVHVEKEDVNKMNVADDAQPITEITDNGINEVCMDSDQSLLHCAHNSDSFIDYREGQMNSNIIMNIPQGVNLVTTGSAVASVTNGSAAASGTIGSTSASGMNGSAVTLDINGTAMASDSNDSTVASGKNGPAAVSAPNDSTVTTTTIERRDPLEQSKSPTSLSIEAKVALVPDLNKSTFQYNINEDSQVQHVSDSKAAETQVEELVEDITDSDEDIIDQCGVSEIPVHKQEPVADVSKFVELNKDFIDEIDDLNKKKSKKKSSGSNTSNTAPPKRHTRSHSIIK